MRSVELLLTIVAVLGVTPQEGWKTVEPGLELVYPRDHGSHPAYRTEWWYVTGRLRTPEGRRFGYQLTVFRSGLAPAALPPDASPLRARQAFAGHLALTDEASGRTLLAERLRRDGTPLARARGDDLHVVLEDWELVRGDEDVVALSAGDGGIGVSLELTLTPAKPLVLHGEAGYSQKGEEVGNASAYASWTRLATAGTLELAGQTFDVEGSSWFDHEFGTSSLGEGVVGWDWFGLQLDDGRELMVFQLRDGTGNSVRREGTLVDTSGAPRHLGAEDVTFTAVETWTSPATGATYPAAWTIAVPDAGIRLEVQPWVADAELVTQHSTDVVYWEGPVSVTGSVTGRVIGGGYAELTGYSGSMKGRL